MTQVAAAAPAATLYERLGGADRLRQMISDVVDAHLQNAQIKARFEPFERAQMKDMAFKFFAMATGGPEVYEGRGLRAVHAGMDVTEAEFVHATDDVMAVLNRYGVGPQEQMEVLAAFFALKGEVLHL